MLKSKCDNKSRFQQSAQGRAFKLQELKKNLQYIITANAEGDQQQVIDDTKRQPGEIHTRNIKNSQKVNQIQAGQI